jgi:hypothetical protein
MLSTSSVALELPQPSYTQLAYRTDEGLSSLRFLGVRESLRAELPNCRHVTTTVGSKATPFKHNKFHVF